MSSNPWSSSLASRRVLVLLSILTGLLALFPGGCIALLVHEGCQLSHDRSWETIESIDTRGRWKLKTRGVDRPGDTFGRGKFYDSGVKSLWLSGNLVLDDLEDCDLIRNRWALAWLSRRDSRFRSREARIVNLQSGLVQSTLTFNGNPTRPFWRGDLGAVFVYDDQGACTGVEMLECGDADVIRHSLFSERDRRAFLKWDPWAPDGTSLAYLTSAWSKSGWERAQLVQVEVTKRPFAIRMQDIPVESLKLELQWSNGKPELVPLK